MRSFVTPLVLDELRLSGEINFLNRSLEQEQFKSYVLKRKVTDLEKRLNQAEEKIKALTLDREADLSRLSALQFRFEREISELKKNIK